MKKYFCEETLHRFFGYTTISTIMIATVIIIKYFVTSSDDYETFLKAIFWIIGCVLVLLNDHFGDHDYNVISILKNTPRKLVWKEFFVVRTLAEIIVVIILLR